MIKYIFIANIEKVSDHQTRKLNLITFLCALLQLDNKRESKTAHSPLTYTTLPTQLTLFYRLYLHYLTYSNLQYFTFPTYITLPTQLT